jgi:signal transduction histidine kinase
VDAAGKVETGDYAARVAEIDRGPGELRDLGRAFNTMAARLEADEAQRRRLLADVSHELRNPLAIVQGNLEALVDGVYPADEAHLTPILDETRVLARLIEDLRTLSLAEAGTLALHREATDLRVLIADVAESFQVRARAAGATLTPDVPAGLPILEVDPLRVREVVSNLVDNALRYVQAGGRVTVSARASDHAIEIAVADDGPGIPPALLPTIFERFAKSAESRGSGLGLAIAKAIVEAHGGTITAESAPGSGTTIRVKLPVSD